jgi:hypothetical protein
VDNLNTTYTGVPKWRTNGVEEITVNSTKMFYLKSTTATFKVMMYEYIFFYIVLPLIAIIDFFLSEKCFTYFFHVHLNILNKVVSS